MKKRILITGANGYIGSYLLERLLPADFQLIALVRNLNKMPGWLLGREKLKIIEGDLNNKTALKKATEKVDIVFHLAAALRMFEKNRELHQTNIVGLKNLLSVCKKANRKIRFIFASSIDVEKKENDYARSKLEGERIVKEFCLQTPKLEYVIVRIGNVYGGKEGGMVKGITEIMNRNNWQSSILYHRLGDKFLYLIEMGNLADKLTTLAKDQKAKSKTITLVDEALTIRQLASRLKKQKLISRYPGKTPFDIIFLKIWRLLGKILRRGDLLVYLSAEK